MGDIVALGAWAWLIAGVVLIGLETLAPGIFLIWFGVAALLTGVVNGVFDLSWQASVLLFGILAIVSVAGGRTLTRRSGDVAGEQPMLNRRGDALVGRIFVLDQPILKGEGRVRVDDSVWRVTGPDMVAGATVKVVRVDGATLVVQSAPS